MLPIFLLCFVLADSQHFGHDMKKHFMMREGITNLNNGAFGTGAKITYDAFDKYNREMEENCNFWYRGGYQPLLEKARQELSEYVNADEEDLVEVENASSGANAVLRSLGDNLSLMKGDQVLYLSTVYPMVKNVMQYISDLRGLNQVMVNISFPLSDNEQVLKPLRDAIAANPRIKIACIDHISSYPAALLPVRDMVRLLTAANIFVLVDGAHALGQVPVDVKAIGASAYITNLHKWMYNPKSACILHVQKQWQKYILPNILSSEFSESVPFATKFQYIGTVNYGALLTAPSAFMFRRSLGDSAINTYNHNLAWEAGNRVAAIWKTRLLVTNRAMVPALSLVVLPTQDPAVVGRVRQVLQDQYDTWIQTGAVVTTDGKTTQYIRLSAQIYLEESDFILMANRFLDIMAKL